MAMNVDFYGPTILGLANSREKQIFAGLGQIAQLKQYKSVPFIEHGIIAGGAETPLKDFLCPPEPSGGQFSIYRIDNFHLQLDLPGVRVLIGEAQQNCWSLRLIQRPRMTLPLYGE